MSFSSETLTLDNISPDDSGPYRVYVTVNGCDSDTSGVLSLSVNPIPIAAAGSNAPVCEGESLQLVASPSGATYQWFGPITSSLQNPLINSADPALHSGTYSLIVTRNGCSSAPVAINVEVNEVPATPMATWWVLTDSFSRRDHLVEKIARSRFYLPIQPPFRR